MIIYLQPLLPNMVFGGDGNSNSNILFFVIYSQKKEDSEWGNLKSVRV